MHLAEHALIELLAHSGQIVLRVGQCGAECQDTSGIEAGIDGLNAQ